MSPKEAGQEILDRKILHQLTYLKVYSCKCYTLLKDKKNIYKPKKLNKLASRAFIDFLINYNSANIYRVWDPFNNKVKGFRDIILNKCVTYYPSVKDNIIKEKEKIK